jgi:hypothetical protein
LALPNDAVGRLITLVEGLDDLSDVRELTAVLAG